MVPIENLACPGNRVLGADTDGLGSHPEFEVLAPIVVLDSVLVVDGLAIKEMAAKGLLHHEDVLEHVRAAC